MKVFVCLKQVPDTETRIKLNDSGVDFNGVKWVINPYDEFAIEEAIKFKESNPGTTVTAVTLGPKSRVNNALLTAMAMGADDSLLIDTDETLDSLTAAQALATAIKNEGEFSFVFAGKLAIDGNQAAVPLMLAERLGIPHLSMAAKADYSDQSVTITREVEGGTKETFAAPSPALVTANKGLNKPRFASLPGIMKAKKKPVKTVNLDDLGISISNKVIFKDYKLPAERPPCKMIEGDVQQQVEELVKLLQEEAKVF